MVVKSSLYLSIGAVNFRIGSRETAINHLYDPPYKEFLRLDNSPAAETVTIRIRPDSAMPDLAAMTKIFDAPGSWSMYSGAAARYIAFEPAGSRVPQWLARVGADRYRIDVFCKSPLNPVRYPLDQILLMHLLTGRGLLIHAAGMVIDNRGYLFAGPSGAGKSTISSFLQAADKVILLSDDRIVVRQTSQGLSMFGTPWPGEACIAVNSSAMLQGIFFLRHGVKDNIRELPAGESLNFLFQVASLPWYDKADLQKSLDFCEVLLEETESYELAFRPGPEIIEDILSLVSG